MNLKLPRSTLSRDIHSATIIAIAIDENVLAGCLWVISAAYPARVPASVRLIMSGCEAAKIPMGATRMTPPHPFELLTTGLACGDVIHSIAIIQVLPGARRAHKAFMWVSQLDDMASGGYACVKYQCS